MVCTCNAGTAGPDGGACTQCVAGTYKKLAGPGACTTCESEHHVSSVGSSECVCVRGFEAHHGRCTHCRAGKYGVAGDGCIACEVGKYSDVTASTMCTLCPADSFQPLPGAASCAPCSAPLVAVPGSSACSAGTVCPGLSSDTANAVAVALRVSRDEMTAEENQESDAMLGVFVAHYSYLPRDNISQSCTDVLTRVVARMRADSDTADASVVHGGIIAMVCIFVMLATE